MTETDGAITTVGRETPVDAAADAITQGLKRARRWPSRNDANFYHVTSVAVGSICSAYRS